MHPNNMLAKFHDELPKLLATEGVQDVKRTDVLYSLMYKSFISGYKNGYNQADNEWSETMSWRAQTKGDSHEQS